MSNSQLTVSMVEDKIGRNADPEIPFRDILNEVCQHYLYEKKYKGSLVVVIFSTSTGFVTLPRRMQSIVGAQFNNYPVPSYPQFHEYLETSFGQYDETQTLGIVQDHGDGWPTQVVQSTVATIRLYPDAADVGEEVRLFGTDSNGEVIFGSDGMEGEVVTLALPYAEAATDMMLTGANKPITNGALNVYTWDGTTSTQIGSWEPTETVPSYHRYKVGVQTKPIRCLCLRRHIDLMGDDDIVYPDNIRALKMGLIAVGYENENNFDDAEKYWNKGLAILDAQLKAQAGNNRLPIAPQFWGQGQGSTFNAA